MNVNRSTTDALDMYALPAKFRLDNVKTLQLDKSLSTPNGRRYLAQHVKRYPLDLRVQVQRILINQDQPQLAGALQDCFIALKDNGLKLRQALFDICKPQLSDEMNSYFTNWLDAGFNDVFENRFIEGSVLATGLNAKAHLLIVQPERMAKSYDSHFQEAIDCLDYGQVDMAQELLEQELMNPDGDPRAESELLRVYDYTNDFESMRRLKDLLEGQGRVLSDDWKQSQMRSN